MAKDISVNNGPVQPPVNQAQTAILGTLASANPEALTQLLDFLSVNKKISDLQLSEAIERRAAQEEILERERKLQLNKIESAAEQARMVKASQAACGHRNEKNYSLVRGMWYPGNKLQCLCQRCAKEWWMTPQGTLVDNDGAYMDPQLVPNELQIGGVR